jgi:hypothetical protein
MTDWVIERQVFPNNHTMILKFPLTTHQSVLEKIIVNHGSNEHNFERIDRNKIFRKQNIHESRSKSMTKPTRDYLHEYVRRGITSISCLYYLSKQ